MDGVKPRKGVDGMASITFSVFADMHYKKGMYATNVSDLACILARAHRENAAFVLHCGDLCNDYKGSPELVRCYLQNAYQLPAYGVYGNHELETEGNTMALVTPLLTNRPDQVIWGTADGTIGDGRVGYYHFDVNGFRFVCTDTNYALLDGQWVHNRPASWGPPAGATHANALGPVQLQWLEHVLTDAAQRALPCIVVSHADFSGIVSDDPSSDGAAVCALFRKVNRLRAGTVVLAINGHYHTDHAVRSDGVVYFDCNTVLNGDWKPMTVSHYTDDQRFPFEPYDADGQPLPVVSTPLPALVQATNTWFFTEPLSAMVTVSTDGAVRIHGAQTAWRYGIAPDMDTPDGKHPYIADAQF